MLQTPSTSHELNSDPLTPDSHSVDLWWLDKCPPPLKDWALPGQGSVELCSHFFLKCKAATALSNCPINMCLWVHGSVWHTCKCTTCVWKPENNISQHYPHWCVCVCACAHACAHTCKYACCYTCVQVRGQFCGGSWLFSPPLHGFQGSNSSHQAFGTSFRPLNYLSACSTLSF